MDSSICPKVAARGRGTGDRWGALGIRPSQWICSCAWISTDSLNYPHVHRPARDPSNSRNPSSVTATVRDANQPGSLTTDPATTAPRDGTAHSLMNPAVTESARNLVPTHSRALIDRQQHSSRIAVLAGEARFSGTAHIPLHVPERHEPAILEAFSLSSDSSTGVQQGSQHDQCPQQTELPTD